MTTPVVPDNSEDDARTITTYQLTCLIAYLTDVAESYKLMNAEATFQTVNDVALAKYLLIDSLIHEFTTTLAVVAIEWEGHNLQRDLYAANQRIDIINTLGYLGTANAAQRDSVHALNITKIRLEQEWLAWAIQTPVTISPFAAEALQAEHIFISGLTHVE